MLRAPSTTDRGIEAHLARMRAGLHRLTPREALEQIRAGAVLVDIRPEFQRRRGGEIPFAVVIERSHLEWRLDPCSPSRIPEAVDHEVAWIVLCGEGHSSSLAAAAVQAAACGVRRT